MQKEISLESISRIQTPNNMELVVTIIYTNYRGETGERKIIPKKIWFGATEWHPEEQWLLEALDVAKNEDRHFAMKDIQKWSV